MNVQKLLAATLTCAVVTTTVARARTIHRVPASPPVPTVAPIRRKPLRTMPTARTSEVTSWMRGEAWSRTTSMEPLAPNAMGATLVRYFEFAGTD
jgi:hypothetical protein